MSEGETTNTDEIYEPRVNPEPMNLHAWMDIHDYRLHVQSLKEILDSQNPFSRSFEGSAIVDIISKFKQQLLEVTTSDLSGSGDIFESIAKSIGKIKNQIEELRITSEHGSQPRSSLSWETRFEQAQSLFFPFSQEYRTPEVLKHLREAADLPGVIAGCASFAETFEIVSQELWQYQNIFTSKYPDKEVMIKIDEQYYRAALICLDEFPHEESEYRIFIFPVDLQSVPDCQEYLGVKLQIAKLNELNAVKLHSLSNFVTSANLYVILLKKYSESSAVAAATSAAPDQSTTQNIEDKKKLIRDLIQELDGVLEEWQFSAEEIIGENLKYERITNILLYFLNTITKNSDLDVLVRLGNTSLRFGKLNIPVSAEDIVGEPDQVKQIDLASPWLLSSLSYSPLKTKCPFFV